MVVKKHFLCGIYAIVYQKFVHSRSCMHSENTVDVGGVKGEFFGNFGVAYVLVVIGCNVFYNITDNKG